MSTEACPGSKHPIRKRLRVLRACIPCRKRKRKCDGRVPCKTCIAYEYHCNYSGDDKTQLTQDEKDEDNISVQRSSAEWNLKTGSNGQNASRQREIDPAKSLVSHSAVTFPRTLALELQSANPPRLHSFGWHCGIRAEEKSSTHLSLTEIITREEYCHLSKVYFAVVHPIFNFVDKEKLHQEAEKCWDAGKVTLEYGSLIAGVAALGSFFSGDLGHPRELDIVQFAKGCIDDPAFSRVPSMEQISGWLLRTIYLRTASSPHMAWLASCTSLHLAEVIGLHHEIDKNELAVMSGYASEKTSGICEHARCIFWCAWSINTILSYDYGRSKVILSKVTCEPVIRANNALLAELVALAHLIPRGSDDSNQPTELLQALEAVYNSPDDHPFLSLTKADLCLSLYRRLRLLNHVLDKSVVSHIIKIGNRALSAALSLVKEGHLWWNVLSSSFQYVCVLLAIDTSESLSNVGVAMSKLDEIVKSLGTTVAYEALSTAQILLQDSMKRKSQQIEQLRGAVHLQTEVQDADLLGIDWDALLDPSITLGFL